MVIVLFTMGGVCVLLATPIMVTVGWPARLLLGCMGAPAACLNLLYQCLCILPNVLRALRHSACCRSGAKPYAPMVEEEDIHVDLDDDDDDELPVVPDLMPSPGVPKK